MSNGLGKQECLDYQRSWVDPALKHEELMSKYTEDAHKYDEVIAGINYTGPRRLALTTQGILKDRHQAKILDVGAGTGLGGEELAKLGYTNIDAVEPSIGLVNVAKSKKVYKKIICQALGNKQLAVEDNTYDIAVMTGVMIENHLPLSALDELIRIVKPGGYIVNICREESRRSAFYKDNFDVYMAQLEQKGKWKEISQTTFPNYTENIEGLILIHQIV